MKVNDPIPTPHQMCLNCGHHCMLASGVENDNSPKPGSITVCIRCGHVMAFDDELKFRELDDEEKEWVKTSPIVQTVLAAHKQTVKR